MSYWPNGLPVAQGSFRFGAGKPKPELALKPAAGGFASARRGRGLAAFDTLTLAGRLRAAAFGFGFGSGLIACRRGRTVCSSCAAAGAVLATRSATFGSAGTSTMGGAIATSTGIGALAALAGFGAA